MLLYDWRMALALLWVVPAFLRRAYLSRRMEKRHIKNGLVTRRAAPDAMQEVLECAPEIKACNQKARLIDDLNRKLVYSYYTELLLQNYITAKFILP